MKYQELKVRYGELLDSASHTSVMMLKEDLALMEERFEALSKKYNRLRKRYEKRSV